MAERGWRLYLLYVAIAALVVGIWLLGEKGLILGVALVICTLLVPFAPWLTFVFLGALLGLCVPMNEVPISAGGMKLYGADALLPLLGAAGVFLIVRRFAGIGVIRPAPNTERWLVWLVVIMSMYGVVSLAQGLWVTGNALADALGSYRRLFFYPLACLLPLLLPFPRERLRYVKWALAIGCGLVILTGCYRLATGHTYRPDLFVVRTTTPDPRLLGYTECTTLALGAAFFAVQAAYGASKNLIKRLAYFVLAGLCCGLLLISGWRLSVALAVASPVAALSVATRMRGGHLRMQALMLCMCVVLAIASLASLRLMLPERWEYAKNRFIDRVTAFDPMGDARFYNWRQAILDFASSPVLGTGLGRQAVFYYRGSGGTFIYQHMSTHSTLFAMLAEGGGIGITFLAVFHSAFLVYMWKSLRKIPPERHALMCGVLAGYCSIWIFSFLQPTQVGGIVSLHLMMGFGILMCRPELNGVAHPQAPCLAPEGEEAQPRAEGAA